MKKKIPRFGVGGTTSGGAYGGLDTVNQGSSQIGKSLGLIEQGLTGEQSNSVGSAGGQQTPTQNLKNLGLNMKRGGIVKKVKKFASGGGAFLPNEPSPSGPMMPPYNSGNGGAYGGLKTVNQGSGQIGKSLGTIQTGLTGEGNEEPPFGPMYKKGGSVKKFAMGGGAPMPPDFPGGYNSGGGGAYGGLNTVNQGSGQIGKSLGTIQSGLTGDGGDNIGPTGPFYPIDKRAEDYQTGGIKPSMKKGGSVSSASKRGDGIAQKGKTRGKMC